MKNVIHIISNKAWGGGERYATDICTALRENGDNVAIVCRRSTVITDTLRKAGFEPAVMRLGGAFDIFSPVNIARMVRHFPGDGPVNIHVHNFKDAATAIRARQLCKDLRRVNIVCTRHLVKPGKQSQLPLYRAIDSIIFVSERARDEFAKGGFDTAGINTCVIHNALPCAEVSAAKPESQPPLILYIGRLAPEKGAHILVEALASLTDLQWRARICGEGVGRYVMPLLRQSRTADLAGRIEWPGHIQDVTAEIAAAQIGVVPTVAPEAFGLSIIEMMRQGLPVVTTDNGAQREIITPDKDGLLVPPGNAQALATSLRRLISEPEERLRLGHTAADRISDAFTYPKFFDAIYSLYV